MRSRPRPRSPCPITASLQTDQKTGLTADQVAQRFGEYGLNELPEKKVNPLLMFLAYFWGPMPIMIWAAALIELGQAAAGLGGWDDFAVLMMLQFANAIVGYIEERNAGDAVQARAGGGGGEGTEYFLRAAGVLTSPAPLPSAGAQEPAGAQVPRVPRRSLAGHARKEPRAWRLD